MSEELYRATVRITPDMTGFDEEARAGVDAGVPNRKDVKIGADTGEAQAKVAVLDEEVKKLDRDAGQASRSLDRFGGGINGIGLGVAALLPAMPVLAGGIGALAGALTAAGAASVGFGAVFATGIHQAVKANQELEQAQKAVNDATTKASRQKALEEQAALINKLGPATIALGQGLHTVSQTWTGFADSFIPQELMLVSGFEKLEKDVLPQLKPLISGTFGVARDELGKLDAAVNSPGGHSFFSWLSTEGPRDLRAITDGLGHFAAGFGHLLVAFTPVEHELVDGFEHIGAKFSSATSDLDRNGTFQKFLATVEKDGPMLVHTLGDAASAIGHIGLAMSPVLPLELKFIDGIATLINDHPAIAGALGAIFLGFQSLKIVGTLTKPLYAFAAAEDAVGLSAKTAAGEAVGLRGALLDLTKIGPIVVPIVLAVATKTILDKVYDPDAASAMGDKPYSGPDVKIPSGMGGSEVTDFAMINVSPNVPAGQLKVDAPSPLDPNPYKTLDVYSSDGSFHKQLPPGLYDPKTLEPLTSSGGVTQGPLSRQGDFNSQVPGTSTSYFGNPNNPDVAMANYMSQYTSGLNNPANFLPLTGGGGAGSGPSKANTLFALAQFQGLDIGKSLLDGIQTGVSPIDQLMDTLKDDIGTKAQGAADLFRNAFDSMLSNAQQVSSTFAPNLISGLPQLGKSYTVTADAHGNLVTREDSPVLGGLQLMLGQDQRFVADITKAQKLGLNKSVIGQFVSAGPSSLSQLDALVNSSPSEIAQINSTFGQITQLGNQFGYQQAMVQYQQQTNALLTQLLQALVSQVPPAIGQQISAALNGIAAKASSRQSTPSQGVYAK